MSQILLERTHAMMMKDPVSQPQIDSAIAKSILIVEDDPSIRDTLGEVFEEETVHQVLLAEDGEAALEILQRATPKLFILDYKLPGMNGLELIERIRSMKCHERTPVLLMSANIFREDLSKYQLKYVRKPFDLDNLLELVESTLASQGEEF